MKASTSLSCSSCARQGSRPFLFTNSRPYRWTAWLKSLGSSLNGGGPVRVHVDKMPRRLLGVEPDIPPQVWIDRVFDDRRAVLLEKRPNLGRQERDRALEVYLVRLEAPGIRRARRGDDDDGDEPGNQSSHESHSVERLGYSRSAASRQSTSPAHLLAKHLGGEPIDGGAALPGFGPKSGLDAGLTQKLLARPAPLGRHLRKQQAPPRARLDDESVHGRSTIDSGSSGSMRSSGPRTETSTVSAVSSCGVTGAKRGSSLAASAAHRTTSVARSRHSSVPRQPRSSP